MPARRIWLCVKEVLCGGGGGELKPALVHFFEEPDVELGVKGIRRVGGDCVLEYQAVVVRMKIVSVSIKQPGRAWIELRISPIVEHGVEHLFGYEGWFITRKEIVTNRERIKCEINGGRGWWRSLGLGRCCHNTLRTLTWERSVLATRHRRAARWAPHGVVSSYSSAISVRAERRGRSPDLGGGGCTRRDQSRQPRAELVSAESMAGIRDVPRHSWREERRG